jgi:regulator of protease activity HflC (stomatin/prohibitin superfamily)
MGIFLGLLFVVLCVVGIAVAVYLSNRSYSVGATICGTLGIAFLCAFVIVPFSFHTVETGEVAVVKEFGNAKEVKTAGLNFDLWITKSYEYVNTKTQELAIETMAYSSDAQPMTIKMAVQYNINGGEALELIKQYGSEDGLKSKLTSIITEAPKTVVSTKPAMEIIANRSEIPPAVEIAINEALGDKYFVTVTQVSITDIDFSDAFEQAVEQKMIAEQDKLKAEYENERKIAEAEANAKADIAKAESKKKIAEAEAEVKKINAEAEAEALKIKSEAEAEANKKIAESITPELLDKIELEKWDGKLPTTVLGEDTDYIINTNTNK